MRGLDPRMTAPTLVYLKTDRPYSVRMGGFVYIMIIIYEHRTAQVKGFTTRYGLHRLVYYEAFDDIRIAVQREKILKHWPREWNLSLIQELSSNWDDLYETLNW